MYRNFIKELLDKILSIILLFLLFPIFSIILLVLLIVNRGKPIFFQQRPGYKGKIFTLIKFRTMTDEVDEKGYLLPDHLRLTLIGKFLRNNSLDELPQILNIIKGDMSWVGPRPLRIEYLPLYNNEQMRRHNVRPGITGWAQVNGRNAITWQQKFEYDVWYVDNLNIWLDLRILYLTVIKVLKRSNVNKSEKITIEPFTGNN